MQNNVFGVYESAYEDAVHQVRDYSKRFQEDEVMAAVRTRLRQALDSGELSLPTDDLSSWQVGPENLDLYRRLLTVLSKSSTA